MLVLSLWIASSLTFLYIRYREFLMDIFLDDYIEIENEFEW